MADVWTDRLSDYIDGELSEADKDSVERHIDTCDECRATVAQLRAVASRAAELEDLRHLGPTLHTFVLVISAS